MRLLLCVIYVFLFFQIGIAQFNPNNNNKIDSVFLEQYYSLIKNSFHTQNYEQTIKASEEILNYISFYEYKDIEIKTKLILAKTHVALNQKNKALRYYYQLINYYKKQQNKTQIAGIYFDIGQLYQQEKLYSKAIEQYIYAYNNYSNINDSTKLFNVMQKLGYCYMQTHKYDYALDIYLKQLQLIKDKSNIQKTIKIYENVINCYYSLRYYNEALTFNEKIIDIYQKYNDSLSLIHAYNNLGYNYKYLKEYNKSLQSMHNAAVIANNLNRINDLASIYKNIGIIKQNIGEQKPALQALMQSYNLYLKTNDTLNMAASSNLIAHYLYNYSKYNKAKQYNTLAINFSKKSNNITLLKKAYLLKSKISKELRDYKTALSDYQYYLNLRDSVLLLERLKKQKLLEEQYINEKTEKQLKLIIAEQELTDLELNKLKLEAEKKEKELTLLIQSKEIQELEQKKSQQELLLTQQKLESEKQNQKILKLNHNKELQEFALKKQKLIDKQRQKEIDILIKDKQIQKLKIDKEKYTRNIIYGVIIILTLILIVIIFNYFALQKSKRKLAEEQKKSNNLLLNILPRKIAQELKDKKNASTQKYESVTVLFADFVSFTKTSQELPPEKLVSQLHTCFSEFDNIVSKYNIEKIKTIGDAYMCAGGLPTPTTTHAKDCVNAAIDMINFINEFNSKPQNHPWEIRIGLFTGPVIAGVVGKRKFAYDIWGDTVNTASRMQSNSNTGYINIGKTTFELVKNSFECTYRGKISVKNKENVDMYFVNKKIEN